MEQKHTLLRKYVGIKFLILFSLLACKNNVKTIDSNTEADNNYPIYGIWHKLTQNNQGDYIIHTPCDAENTTILLKENEKSITVNYGIETQIYVYTSITQKKDFIEFEGVKSFDKVSENIKLNLQENIGTWYLPNDFKIITSKQTDNYKAVKEECNSDSITVQDQINEYKKLGFSLLEKYLHDINGDNKKDAFLLFKQEKSQNNLLCILINENGSFNIWKQSKKIISNIDFSSCPAEGFSNIAFKNNFFTVEESICDGWMFIDNYITFKYDKSVEEIYLHKHGLVYTDRRNPNKELPERIYTKEQFGDITFKQFDNKNTIWVK